MNENSFFQDMAILTAIVGVASVIFAKLKWPKVLGYIAAGVLMSQYTWGGSFLLDAGSFGVIGQLGVVYLMFTMGLDFSMAQIKRMKTIVLPIALIDTLVMAWIGYTIGTSVLGWDTIPSLALGVAICDSATTMLAKVIDEMKWGDRPFVRYALGTSVCEDIICVGMIALVTGVLQGQGISLKAAGASLGGLFVFFMAVIIFGMILVPRLLVSVAKMRDDEALLLTILGFCFFVSWIAFKFDFSLAIGAFLVGIIGASSDVRKRLAELVAPLKSLYAAIFFVSIGLMFNPVSCVRNLPTILFVAAVVMGGKFVNCAVGGLLTGQSVKTSVQMGMSLAQIGEFAFMVALLYQNASGDSTCPIFDIVVAVSVLTTLLNPTMIRLSAPVGEWIEDRLPSRPRRHLATYRGFVAKFQSSGHEVALHGVVRSCFLQLGVVAILNFALSIAFSLLVGLDYSKFSAFLETHKRFVFCLVANLFILSMLIPALRIGKTLGRAFSTVIVGREDAKWQQAMRQVVSYVVLIGIFVLFLVEMSLVNANVNLAPEDPWARWTIRSVLLLAAIFGWRLGVKAVDRAGTRFAEALSAEERLAKLGAVMTFSIPEDHTRRLTIDLVSPAIGATVGSLNIRAKTGAVIVSIERDGDVLRNIGPDTELQVGDTLLAVGEGHQIAALKDLLGIVEAEV